MKFISGTVNFSRNNKLRVKKVNLDFPAFAASLRRLLCFTLPGRVDYNFERLIVPIYAF